jgi:hypothetical protein
MRAPGNVEMKPSTREKAKLSLVAPEGTEDFAEEAAPKKSEFSTEADAKAMTNPPFELIP